MARTSIRILLVGALAAAAAQAAVPAPITHGSRDRREVALTFDADMTQGMLGLLESGKVARWYDPELIAYLRRTRTPATVFLTGLWAKTYPGIVRSLARDRLFELENHSYDHAAWKDPCYGLPVVKTAARKRFEVAGSARIIESVAGRAPRYFRFPGGCFAPADLAIVAAAGERVVGWDVVSGDAFQPDPAVVERAVLDGVRPGSIVVMHFMGAPNAPATAAALKIVVPELKARGYRFVTLRELLR